MDLGLTDAKVIVTGGASHIGRAIVLQLAAEGAQVVIVDRDEVQARRTAEAATAAGRRPARVVRADGGTREAAEAACAEAIGLLDGVDVLVSNVGYNHPD